MEPVWLIEGGVFGESAELLRGEVRRQGMSCHVVQQKTLFASTPPRVEGTALGDDACVIFYGSFPLMRHIQIHTCWNPGGWCSADQLACSTYYAYFGQHLLNRRYAMMPGVEAVRQAEWLFTVFGRDGEVFVRPSGVLKVFTGRCVMAGEFAGALAATRYDPATLVVVAEPREIEREWRTVIAKEGVVAASQYLDHGVRAIVTGCPKEVRDFATNVMRDVGWRPDEMFMMDVCESEGRLHVLELNSFSCSGLYACDLGNVVRAATEAALAAWERGKQNEIDR